MNLELIGLKKKKVVVDGANIRIVREGGVFAAQRDKTIPIRNINAVDIKKPGVVNGYIQFVLAGGKHLNSSFTYTGGAYDAFKDENSVAFNDDYCYRIALKIKEYVEQYDTSAAPRQAVSVAAVSGADEILKYKQLWDQGIITAEEFEAKKRQLLK